MINITTILNRCIYLLLAKYHVNLINKLDLNVQTHITYLHTPELQKSIAHDKDILVTLARMHFQHE